VVIDVPLLSGDNVRSDRIRQVSLHTDMTHIGKSVVFDGELSSDEDLRFEGTLKGHIHLRDASLTIGEGATVEADIRARQVLVLGTVKGSIAAGQRIELTATARVNGTLTADRVVIADGARFNGGVDMGRRTIVSRMAQVKSGQSAQV
jgi:cytoskeletal protein CcmA (bactofilin family)